MSSVLEFGADELDFLQNQGTGLLAIIDSEGDNTIFIREDPTAPVGNDTVFGGDANDNIFTGEGDDEIIGGDGLDFLSGGSGNDIIKGGGGNDIIDGGTGKDLLAGGEGADIFKFQLEDFQDGEVDIIQDFEQGVDNFLLGSDIDTDLISVEGNLVKYDGETVIEVQGDELDLEDLF